MATRNRGEANRPGDQDGARRDEQPRTAADVPAPKGQADVPAPKGQADVPAPKGQADVPAPKGQADVPAPKGEAEVPAPKGEADIPAPKGQADMPAPKGRADTRRPSRAPAASPQTTAPRPQESHASGSLAELFQRLALLGISPEAFIAALGPVDLADVAACLHYLSFVDISGADVAERLPFHLDLLRSEPPSSYAQWARLLQDVRNASQLSASSADFVSREDIAERLHSVLLQRAGLSAGAPLDTREHLVAYFRSMFRFLESARSLMAADANLELILKAIARDGSLQQHYARDPAARRTVQRMIEAGYDVDYLVFGRQDILTLGPSKVSGPDSWASRLVAVARALIGTREESAELDVGLNRGKLFHEIKDDYAAAKDRQDAAAGLRVIDALLGAVEQRQATLLQSGLLSVEAKVNQIVQELRYLRRTLMNDAGSMPEPQRLRAVRSKQQVPEILFDNTRFACCLFKPSGLFHGEIARLLLDPATPMMELWLDPYPEFLGLVTLYPGINARGERTILMDTVDYDDRLLDLRGNNGTLRFMLDAMVVDAHLAGAKKLLVFAAPYGKPINFANFVKGVEPRFKSIVYHESYPFRSVDPEDSALASSRTGKHHYTVALGYDKPMRGVIDYGHNLVSRTRVEKHRDAGRGVFEIDVEAFIREVELTDRIPEKRAGVAAEADASIHRRPSFHAEEIARREEEAFKRGVAAIQAAAPELTVERAVPTDDLVPELLAVETAAYPEVLRYAEKDFRARFLQQDAELILLRRGGALVGFAFTYESMVRPPGELFLDDIALLPEHQNKGVGSGLLATVTGLATVRGRAKIHALARRESSSQQLVRFYERNGFKLLGDFKDVGLHVEKTLGITGPDNREAIEAVMKEAGSRLATRLTKPRITFHTSLDPHLLRTVNGLEAAFPEHLRYTSSQFRERMACRDAYCLIAWEQSEPIGYCISFHDPSMAEHTMRLDTMSVRPDFQKHGIGTMFETIVLGLPVLAGYTVAVYFCESKNRDGLDLVDFYSRFGAEIIDSTPTRVRMTSPLRGPVMDCFNRYKKSEG